MVSGAPIFSFWPVRQRKLLLHAVLRRLAPASEPTLRMGIVFAIAFLLLYLQQQLKTCTSIATDEMPLNAAPYRPYIPPHASGPINLEVFSAHIRSSFF